MKRDKQYSFSSKSIQANSNTGDLIYALKIVILYRKRDFSMPIVCDLGFNALSFSNIFPRGSNL
jgi:hypothetical protein